MELKKTRNELLEIAKELNTLNLNGVKLCYAIARSADKIREELKAIHAARKPLTDYDQRQTELAQLYAAKDAEGNAQRTTTGFIVADLAGFNQEMDDLKKQFKKELAELNAFMEEEITIKVHAVSEDDIPEDITMAQMKALLPLIQQKE